VGKEHFSMGLMALRDVLYVTLKRSMSDIIPLEVSRIDQLRVYMIQSVIWVMAKALNTL
jgi:hypothetical protein